MKKQIVSIVMAGILFLFLQSFVPEHIEEKTFPEEISTILEPSCYSCHTTGAKSKDALKAVNFSDWDAYRLTKKLSLLGEICKVVEEGKMPPRKFLEHKPEAKISEAQQKLLCEWTREESEKLMKED